MPWLLEVEPWRGERARLEVGAKPLVVGRGEASAITFADTQVSRQHSRFDLRGDELWVEDLGSHNGTRVNGLRLTKPHRLEDGDVVEISAHRIVARRVGAGGEVRAEPTTLRTVYRDASEPFPRPPVDTDAAGALELERYVERLHLVSEIHQALGGSFSESELLELILDRIFRHLRPEQAALLLLQPGGEPRLAASRPQPLPTGGLLSSRSLLREVVEKRVAALVIDALADERFAAAQSILDSGVRSVLAAPLLTPDRVLGLVVLSSRRQVRQFDEEDLELLVSLASAAALHLRNLALAEEAAERRRLEQELALARRIQVALLPEHLPEVPGFELVAGNLPSRGVSGDLYTAVERDEGRQLALMVADVSGKGMAASLLGASLEALAVDPIEGGYDAAEICRRVSRRLYRRTPPEKYATAFVAVLELATSRLDWANAGHNPALLLRAGGGIERLPAGGPPLGLLPGADYGQGSIALGAGDLLVVYTDGITEASDPDDVEFGLDRLTAVCRELCGAPLGELREAIETHLAEFVRGTPFADDRTLLLLRRERSPSD